MNDPFDELARPAQSATRRGARKKFGVGLAGIALASLGLANKAHAGPKPFHCRCYKPYYGCDSTKVNFPDCTTYCGSVCP